MSFPNQMSTDLCFLVPGAVCLNAGFLLVRVERHENCPVLDSTWPELDNESFYVGSR